MSVENFWRQLKHDYLHHLLRPRLDQLVWIIQTQVVPNYMARATFLEDVYRLGPPKHMTTFQSRFKREWGRLTALPLSGRPYETSVTQWTCTCDALKYNCFHLCKHLIQSIPPPPITFFREVIRRRTEPLYQHPALHVKGTQRAAWQDPDDGSITDGDDHLWHGDTRLLSNGKWRELLEDPLLTLGKRKSSVVSEASSDADGYERGGSDWDSYTEATHDNGPDSELSGSEDEEEVRTSLVEQTHMICSITTRLRD